MVEYTSIKISKELSEKIQLIKKANGYKSVNEVLEKTLDKTINERFEPIKEQALFYVGDQPITFTILSKADLNTAWESDDLLITVLFKDNTGVFLRFETSNDVYCEYYHFL